VLVSEGSAKVAILYEAQAGAQELLLLLTDQYGISNASMAENCYPGRVRHECCYGRVLRRSFRQLLYT